MILGFGISIIEMARIQASHAKFGERVLISRTHTQTYAVAVAILEGGA